jgi:hypothetical protein
MSCRTIVLVVLVAIACGCGRPLPPHPVPPEPMPPETVPPVLPSDGGACARLTELACIDSDRCTLAVTEDGSREYVCREAAGPCETGFRQRGNDADACEAKSGCRFVPGRCYCSPDVTCICGGGPPPQCVES